MKTIVAAGLAVVALGCGSAPGESTQTSSNELQTEQPITAALKCVAIGRYEVVGAIVADKTDGKLWQRAIDPERRTQSEAVAYCATLELEERTDWHLPQADELVNIRLLPGLIKGGPGYCVPSIDHNAFPDTPADQFWTGTTRPENQAVYTDFADGRSHFCDPTERLYVRCVHARDVSAIGTLATPSLPR